MKKDLNTLLDELTHIHPDFKRIHADKVEVGDWVRWKCKYGCKAYGKHLNCPPHVPSPDDTRKLIRCYEHAIVVRFDAKPNREVQPSHVHHFLWDAIKAMYDTMFELERHAFLTGYYKALAMVGLCCAYCDECIPERRDSCLDHAVKGYCKLSDLNVPREDLPKLAEDMLKAKGYLARNPRKIEHEDAVKTFERMW
nr:hypothetical protein BSM_04060 [uncultured archaeon]